MFSCSFSSSVSSMLSKVMCNVLYKCIDVQEKVMDMYFQMFDNSVVSVRAYSNEKIFLLYHVFFSFLYPLRTFKCNDVIYEDNVMLEVVHNKDKKIITTILPAKEIIPLSSRQFQDNMVGVQAKKADVLSFSLNEVPFIQVFNQVCHSFQKYTIYTNDFALYVIKKYKLMIKPPYSLEIIDNDFNEQTFKENDTIKINKFHEQ